MNRVLAASMPDAARAVERCLPLRGGRRLGRHHRIPGARPFPEPVGGGRRRTPRLAQVPLHVVGQQAQAQVHPVDGLDVRETQFTQPVRVMASDLLRHRLGPRPGSSGRSGGGDGPERGASATRSPLTHPALLVVDEIGCLSVTANGAKLFFQLINSRYGRASTVLTSNKEFEDWGDILHDEFMAAALPDRLLHRCHIVNIRGNSYRMRRHKDLSKAVHPTASRAVVAEQAQMRKTS